MYVSIKQKGIIMTVHKTYIEVTDKEREILSKKADAWMKTTPSPGKFWSSPALVKQTVMEFIANMNGKTIFEAPIVF